MSKNNKLYFDILIHPWISLKDILEWENMTQSDLSLRTEISEKHISNIIKGKANITPETALKFHKVFWVSAEFWNNMQKSYEEDKARLEEKELMAFKIEEEKEILSEIKDGYKDLAENSFVDKVSFVWQKNKEIILNNLYNFLRVSSLKNILNIFKINLMYKKTNTLKLNKYNLACWLRWWEVKIEKLEVWEYSKIKLKETLVELKKMTKNDVVDISKIQKLLAGAWVYFSFVAWFKNVPVFWITRRYMWKPFVQVSDKWKKADWFWFALFHELAHVQLHLHKKDDILINANEEDEIFINITDDEDIKEQEANKWASDYFINKKEYEVFLNSSNITVEKLIKFSEQNWVWSNIVAWRLWFDHDIYWWEISKLRISLKVVNY